MCPISSGLPKSATAFAMVLEFEPGRPLLLFQLLYADLDILREHKIEEDLLFAVEVC